MAQSTLLELTQDILGEMGSDAVNSISDTDESTRVASIIRQVYKELVDEMDLPGKKDVTNLTGLADTAKPNYMRIPQGVTKIGWVKYDNRIEIVTNKKYDRVSWLDPLAFIECVNGRPSEDTDKYLTVMHSPNIPLIIDKTKGPTYWTSFDDDYVVFDSYNQDVDSTLQESKSICEVYYKAALVLDDASIPAIPPQLENLLYTQSLNRCQLSIKNEPNQKTERNESRLRVRSQRNKWRQGRIVHNGPNYSRK